MTCSGGPVACMKSVLGSGGRGKANGNTRHQRQPSEDWAVNSAAQPDVLLNTPMWTLEEEAAWRNVRQRQQRKKDKAASTAAGAHQEKRAAPASRPAAMEVSPPADDGARVRLESAGPQRSVMDELDMLLRGKAATVSAERASAARSRSESPSSAGRLLWGAGSSAHAAPPPAATSSSSKSNSNSGGWTLGKAIRQQAPGKNGGGGGGRGSPAPAQPAQRPYESATLVVKW